MKTVNWSKLFPGNWSSITLVLYIVLYVNQGIFVKWSQKNRGYNYNIVVVVLMTAVLKLIISVLLYYRENTTGNLFKEVLKNKRLLLLYLLPATLYCLYQNLSFVNLAAFDPTTYVLLLQLRIVATGIIFQIIFKKQLSTKQWTSLVLLTVGCMIKHLNLDYKTYSKANFQINFNITLIFIQTICSCLGGVYHEYLLKKERSTTLLQNVFMYIDSILCNVAVLIMQGNILQELNDAGSNIFMDPKVILVICNNAAIGIINSFLLKNFNSIVKNFAGALIPVFTALSSWIFFGIPIYFNTFIAIVVVSYAIILY